MHLYACWYTPMYPYVLVSMFLYACIRLHSVVNVPSVHFTLIYIWQHLHLYMYAYIYSYIHTYSYTHICTHLHLCIPLYLRRACSALYYYHCYRKIPSPRAHKHTSPTRTHINTHTHIWHLTHDDVRRQESSQCGGKHGCDRIS